MALDQETIDALLRGELNKTTTGRPIKSAIQLPRPTQLGPLKWAEDTKPCCSRGCTSPTFIRVRGIPYCTSHALNVLNAIILDEIEGVDLTKCTCKAGRYSYGNIHTHDCDLVSTTIVDAADDGDDDELL